MRGFMGLLLLLLFWAVIQIPFYYFSNNVTEKEETMYNDISAILQGVEEKEMVRKQEQLDNLSLGTGTWKHNEGKVYTVIGVYEASSDSPIVYVVDEYNIMKSFEAENGTMQTFNARNRIGDDTK